MLCMQDGDTRSSAPGTGESTSWAHAACRSSIYGHYQCTSEYALNRGGDQRIRRRDREDRCSWPSAFGKQEMECGEGKRPACSLFWHVNSLFHLLRANGTPS